MATNLEHCCECDALTGRCGRHEDSMYVVDDGPYCEDCYRDIVCENCEGEGQTNAGMRCEECHGTGRRVAALTQAQGGAE